MRQRHRWMVHIGVVVGVAMAGAGLSSTPATSAAAPAAPIAATGKGEFTRAPYAGAYEPQGVDERGLWMQLDEYERSFRDSPAVLRDQKLTAYIQEILCRTVGAERCAAIRTYVVKDDSFNASMAPNGLMVVHTGLLVRVHSEAELAAVLGHEFAHFERRHSLNVFRKGRSTADAVAWISLLGAVSRTSLASTSNSLVLGFITFNRDQESEADALSAQLLRASPYRLRASGIWRRLVDEEDALRKERGLRKIKHMTPGLLDSHPPEMQRFAFFAKQEAEAGDVGEDGTDRYRDATAPILRDLFEPLIKGNDFAAADYVIRARGDALGWDGQLYFLRGELYRLRGNPRDLATAQGFFQQAAAQPLAPPETWRGLGLCAMRLGNITDGRLSLTEYLKRSPNAADGAAIRLLVEN